MAGPFPAALHLPPPRRGDGALRRAAEMTGAGPPPGLLTDPSRIWLILQRAAPVAGQALESDVGVTAGEPVTG